MAPAMSGRILVGDNAVARDLAGEVMILDLETGTYFGLNATGSRIWRLIEEHGSRERVVAALLEEYEADEARLRLDVDRMIARLMAKGLVRSGNERDLDHEAVGAR